MPKLKPGTIFPTGEENAAIDRDIASSSDTYDLAEQVPGQLKRIGRPPSPTKKVPLTVRYDADVIEAFKAGGEGWQTRMNNALRDWLRQHRT